MLKDERNGWMREMSLNDPFDQVVIVIIRYT